METYEGTLKKILEIPKFTSKNTLSHTREFLRRLGNPQDGCKAIHVAGSNGKGSVCAFIDSALRAGGKRVGLFTSPHLVHLEERFALDGKPCSRQELIWASGQVGQAAASMVQEGLPHPTFFEYIFAMGMVIFAHNNIEYAVLETGLGGRLDATNIIGRPLVTVITSISLEHTEILGDTLEEIAAQKAGILKPGVPVVYDASLPEVEGVIVEKANSLHCEAYPVRQEKIKILLNTGKKIDFSYDSGYDVTKVSIPFGAPYQVQNAAVALQALGCISQAEGVSKEAVRQGLASVSWKGRMQEVQQDIYFDGAHNLSGIEKFLEAVRQITEESAVLLFSMVKEKDYIHAVERLLIEGDWKEIVVTTVPGTRGVGCKTLAALFEQAARSQGRPVKVTGIEDVAQAYAYALGCRNPGQKLFCAGSLYLIGELEQITGGMQND
jgi:dihydrofolate synthase/folylpolyglutamate synthase